MSFFTKKNFARGALASGITAVATQVTLTAGHTLPASGSFRAVIWNVATYPYPPNDPNMEIVTAVLNAGNVYDITRAQEGTSASAHATSDRMALELTAGQIQEIETGTVAHSLATVVNDFLVASGAGAFVKKTLAEVKTILGLGSAAYTASTDYVAHSLATAVNDFLVASGSGVFVKKTQAEVQTILGLGAVIGAIATKTANYALLISDETLYANGTITIFLPTGSTVIRSGQSKIYIIKNIHASLTATVQAQTGDTINGGSSGGTTKLLPGQAITLITDGGTDWKVVSSSQSKQGTLARDLSLASGNVSYTGWGFRPKTIHILGFINGTGNFATWGFGNLSNQHAFGRDSTAGVYRDGGGVLVASFDGSNPDGTIVTIVSMDEDGSTWAWTKNGTPTGTLTVAYLALG